MFQNLILFRINHSKIVYYQIFLHIMVFLRKQITAEVGALRDKNFQKRFFASKTSIKTCFFYKSNSLRNLILCKTCLFEIWLVQNYGFEICRVVKNGSNLTRLKVLIQNMTRCTKNDSKTVFFQKFRSQFFFEWRKIFPQQLFQECKKSQHWHPYGVFWPAKLFFESQFSKEFWFSNNTFSIENWCVVNILTQFLTLCGNQFKLWQEVFYFF